MSRYVVTGNDFEWLDNIMTRHPSEGLIECVRGWVMCVITNQQDEEHGWPETPR